MIFSVLLGVPSDPVVSAFYLEDAPSHLSLVQLETRNSKLIPAWYRNLRATIMKSVTPVLHEGIIAIDKRHPGQKLIVMSHYGELYVCASVQNPFGAQKMYTRTQLELISNRQ